MRLVSDARRAWRWFSMQALALLAIIPVVWAELPPEVAAIIPAGWYPWIVTGVAVAGMIGRLVDQGGRA